MPNALTLSVQRYAAARPGAEGLIKTPIANLGILRASAPTGIVRDIYRPALCLVLQGAKQVTTGREVLDFTAGQSAIIAVDRPVSARVIGASRQTPYLALGVGLDMALLREIIAEVGGEAPTTDDGHENTVFLDETDREIADCADRLMRLLDRPSAVPLLHPAIVREMHAWLLAGRHGPAIRGLARLNGHAQRIGRAISILRAEFAQSIPVGRLATASGMSTSAFHQHFKAITTLSPLQFQKQIRLLEARRLMLTEGMTASRAGFAVGYESVPQFTREYGRMFGASPRWDAEAAQAA